MLPFILILTACSLEKDSAYWSEDPIKKFTEDKKLSKILKKIPHFKKMTFNEFSLYLKDYSKKADFPDINN